MPKLRDTRSLRCKHASSVKRGVIDMSRAGPDVILLGAGFDTRTRRGCQVIVKEDIIAVLFSSAVRIEVPRIAIAVVVVAAITTDKTPIMEVVVGQPASLQRLRRTLW